MTPGQISQYNDIKAKVRELCNSHIGEFAAGRVSIHMMTADTAYGGRPDRTPALLQDIIWGVLT